MTEPMPPAEVIAMSPAATATPEMEREVETKLLVEVRDHASREAFKQLYDRFTPRLIPWISAQGADRQMAENVVQEVMVNAWTRARQFDDNKASARTWLYTMARNRMIDYHRANTRRQKAHDGLQAQSPEIAVSEDVPERAVISSEMSALLKQLPVEQREILLLTYVDGYTHREIAVKLDIPIGTVKSRTRLAFQRLRRALGETE